MNYFDTLFAKKYGVGGGSMFATLFGKSLGGATPPAPVMPTKGDIIGIDMDGDGTDEQYLVLKAVGSDNVVEVLARASIGDSVFASSGPAVYENNALDAYLNTTYYATLSADAKAAIVDKTFRQDTWYRNLPHLGNPLYNGSYGTSATAYQLSLGKASFGNEISRHIYALSVQDIIDYLGVTPEMASENSTLNMANLREMFNTTDGNIWLCSARADDNSSAERVNGTNGYVNGRVATYSYAVLPAFQIDLDKIAWTPSNS